MNTFAQNARVQETRGVDRCYFVREAFYQAQQPLQSLVGEHIVNPEPIEIGANSIDTPSPLDHPGGIPMQIVVDQVATVLKILALREYVGGDENVDLLVRAE